MHSKEQRDANGFIILQRLPKPGRPRHIGEVTDQPTGPYIGEYPLRTEYCSTPNDTVSPIVLAINGLSYTVMQEPKSWQYKAWTQISRQLNGDFTAHVKSDNIRLNHLCALAVSVTVDGYRNNTRVARLDTMKGEYGKYIIGTTRKEIENILNTCNNILTIHLEEYRDKAKKAKCEYIQLSSKIMMIYDDYSYDAFMVNINRLFKMLGFTFGTTGGIKL